MYDFFFGKFPSFPIGFSTPPGLFPSFRSGYHAQQYYFTYVHICIELYCIFIRSILFIGKIGVIGGFRGLQLLHERIGSVWWKISTSGFHGRVYDITTRN